MARAWRRTSLAGAFAACGVGGAVASKALAACFEDSLFPMNLCCDTQHGPRGFEHCWNELFSYEYCCRDAPPPRCTKELCDRVWDFIEPNSPHSFREFFADDSFYEIPHVWPRSRNCTMAYIVSRILSMTKLPGWDEQWAVLFEPARAMRSDNFQLPSVVQALHTAFAEVDLWTVLSSPPWSAFIFGRLYAHKKKMAYYLNSDNRPLLEGVLPPSDAQPSARDEAFLQATARALNHDLPPAAAEAAAFLGDDGSAPLGAATAHLVLALHALARPRGAEAPSEAVEGARGAALAAGGRLREYLASHSFGDVFLTRWPLLRLMAHIARTAQGTGASEPAAVLPPRQWARPAPRVLVLSCAPVPVTPPAPGAWAVREAPGACGEGVRRIARQEAAGYDWVLIASPHLWEWTLQHARAVQDVLWKLEDDGSSFDVVGLPTVARNGTYTWPPRQLGTGGRRLTYKAYPTGYPAYEGPCATGDTTSGTRAIRSAALLRWLEDSTARSGTALLVELDVLAARDVGEPGAVALTCIAAPLHEDSYLGEAELPDEVAGGCGFEVADFSPTRRAWNCQAGRQGAPAVLRSPGDLDTQPPCAEKDLQEVLGAVAAASGEGSVVVETRASEVASACAARVGALCVAVGPRPQAEALPCRRACRRSPTLSCSATSGGFQVICGEHRAACLVCGATRSDGGSLVQAMLWNSTVWLAGEGSHGGGAAAGPRLKADQLSLLYCGPLDVAVPQGWGGRAARRPLAACADALRAAAAEMPAEGWSLLLSPYAWEFGPAEQTAVAPLVAEMRRRNMSIAGFPTLDRGLTWRWPATELRHRYWKLAYGGGGPMAPDAARGCESGGSTSGTRVYDASLLRRLLPETTAQDPAMFLVELDVLAAAAGGPPAWTCASRPMREEPFLRHASLPAAFSERYQIELATYAGYSSHISCLSDGDGSQVPDQSWNVAHEMSNQRLATRWCYRKRTEERFCQVVNWWRAVDPEKHFVSAKAGTLLTGMVRGGDVSMMPWDNDLEMSFHSTGVNPILDWCSWHTVWRKRALCIAERLEAETGMMVRATFDTEKEWLHDAQLVFSKLRVDVDFFDVGIEGHVEKPPIAVQMFGCSEFRLHWQDWEYLFFEVFGGSLMKKVGTSGNIDRNAVSCEAGGHNACIPRCGPHAAGGGLAARLCVVEFNDYFAHSRSLPDVAENI